MRGGSPRKFFAGRDGAMLRLATKRDQTFVLKVRNAARTRLASFHTKRISWPEHAAWFARTLHDPRVKLYVIEKGQHRRIGTLRLNRLEENEAEIHLALLPTWQGRGYGSKAVCRVLSHVSAGRPWACERVTAHIRKDNTPSLRFFARLGFAPVTQRACRGHGRVCETLRWCRRNIVFVVDAGSRVGMGHVMRALALGRALAARHYECFFFVRIPRRERNTVHKLFRRARSEHLVLLPDHPPFSAWIERGRPCCVIVDALKAPPAPSLQRLKAKGIPIAFVGSYMKVPRWADLCVNPYCRSQGGSSRTVRIESPRYTILSEEFEVNGRQKFGRSTTRSIGRRVLVLAGGGDTHGMVFKILDALSTLPSNCQVDVILGDFFTRRPKLLRQLRGARCRVQFWQGLRPASVSRLMASADVGLFSFGRSLDEARRMGLPSLALSSSRLHHVCSMEAAKRGGVVYLGDFRGVREETIREETLRLLSDSNLRRRMGRQGQQVIDGQGSRRVASVIETLISRHARWPNTRK